MYKILGGDGNEYGPVSADTLRQWVREGRANALTQVKAEGSANWQPLSSYPELAAPPAVQVGAPPTIGAIPSAAASAFSGVPYEGDYELDITGCLSRAWSVLSANFWLVVGGCAIYLLIIGGLAGMAQIPFIGLLFSLVSIIITGPLMGGVYLFLLRVLRGQPTEVGEVFAGFRDNLGQLILAHIMPALIAGAVALPGIILAVVPGVLMARSHEPNVGLIILLAFGVLLALVPLIYCTTCWAFTIPLVADRRLEFWPAMKASRAQVGRHWWMVFALVILVGLINFVGLILCCVGIFVTTPLCFLALACAYETLFASRAPQPGPRA